MKRIVILLPLISLSSVQAMNQGGNGFRRQSGLSNSIPPQHRPALGRKFRQTKEIFEAEVAKNRRIGGSLLERYFKDVYGPAIRVLRDRSHRNYQPETIEQAAQALEHFVISQALLSSHAKNFLHLMNAGHRLSHFYWHNNRYNENLYINFISGAQVYPHWVKMGRLDDRLRSLGFIVNRLFSAFRTYLRPQQNKGAFLKRAFDDLNAEPAFFQAIDKGLAFVFKMIESECKKIQYQDQLTQLHSFINKTSSKFNSVNVSSSENASQCKTNVVKSVQQLWKALDAQKRRLNSGTSSSSSGLSPHSQQRQIAQESLIARHQQIRNIHTMQPVQRNSRKKNPNQASLNSSLLTASPLVSNNNNKFQRTPNSQQRVNNNSSASSTITSPSTSQAGKQFGQQKRQRNSSPGVLNQGPIKHTTTQKNNSRNLPSVYTVLNQSNSSSSSSSFNSSATKMRDDAYMNFLNFDEMDKIRVEAIKEGRQANFNTLAALYKKQVEKHAALQQVVTTVAYDIKKQESSSVAISQALSKDRERMEQLQKELARLKKLVDENAQKYQELQDSIKKLQAEQCQKEARVLLNKRELLLGAYKPLCLNPGDSPYDILAITQNASKEEVQSAYVALVQQCDEAGIHAGTPMRNLIEKAYDEIRNK